VTFATTTLRTIGALTAGLLSLGTLAACTPEPNPTPTKTALFASDEEAFAAAEKTYQAYLSDLNATDLTKGETFEPVYAWLTGTALAAEKKSLSLYHAEGIQRRGETTFDTFTPVSNTDDSTVANLCLDVTEVDLVDSSGSSVLPSDRLKRRALKVTFTSGDTHTQMKISSNHEPESFSC